MLTVQILLTYLFQNVSGKGKLPVKIMKDTDEKKQEKQL